MAEWVEYRADLEHPDWKGSVVQAEDRWWRSAEGKWDCDYGNGRFASAFNWDVVADDVLVPVVPVDPPHTDADLAMALELADLVGKHSRRGVYNACGRGCLDCSTANWLRAEVVRTLRERTG